MPILANSYTGSRLSADHSVEARLHRIIRYCLGKPLTPGAEQVNQYAQRKDDTDDSATVPPFGRVGRWVDEEQHEKLWKFDIDRLMRAAEASDVSKLQPDLEEDEELKSWHLSDENFSGLGKLADQILYSLWLFSYDDEALLREHGFPPCNRHRGPHAFWNLQSVNGQVPDLPGKSFVAKLGHLDEGAVKPSEKPARPELNVTRKEQYCYIVDQITSVLAHIACNSIESSYWRLVVLACLAKISTKMKVLATCLQDTINKPRREIKVAKDDGNYNVASKQPIVVQYCREYIAVSSWLAECIDHVLRNLGAQKPLYEDRNSLDICTLVYEAGTRGTHTQIYEDRWGTISGSTDRLGIHWTLTSLDIGYEMLQTLPPPSRLPPTVKRGHRITTQATADTHRPHHNVASGIEGKTSIKITVDTKHKSQVKDIWNMINFVVMVIPLSLASPLLGRGFASNLGDISSRVDIHWGTHQKIELQNAFFSMHRVERQSHGSLSEGIAINVPTRQGHTETTTLAQSWLVRHRYRPLWRSSSSSNSLLHQLNSDAFEHPNIRAQKDRDRVKRITDQWIIQETSIVIKCPKYVNTVFGLTVVLVVGGFLCGLLVGSRVEGVDPFNFTAFSWLLGGFILLIAKIVRVSDGTWRDFLQRQVTCRSVCEVANVSELSQQEVLTYLLSSENHHILRTGGPFQKVFTRTAVENGFSIDVSPDIQTLLASGIITVKVLTVHGEALVWLRLIPGSGRVQQIPVYGKADRVEIFACVDVPQPGDGSEDLDFSRQRLSWTKVLGVYNAVEKRIR